MIENIIVWSIVATAAGSLLWKLYRFVRSMKKVSGKQGCDKDCGC